MDIDWEALRREATEAAGLAYAPYSGYRVGAAALVEDGRLVRGCNVENAAYGVTLCAECGLVSQLHLTGGGRLTHFVCVNGDGEVIMPCGRCRQLLSENGGPRLELMTVRGVRTMAEVLPDAFGPHDLERDDLELDNDELDDAGLDDAGLDDAELDDAGLDDAGLDDLERGDA
jgi:cytidine deaminase